MSSQDLDSTAAAWTEARKKYPDLSPLLDLEEGIYASLRAMTEFVPELEALDEARVREAWSQGNPAFTFENLQIDWGVFSHVVSWVGGLVVGSLDMMSQSEAAWRLEQLVRADATELYWMARGVYEGEPQGDFEDNLIGSALKPFFWQARKAVEPLFDPSTWTHGWCPICGAGPDFASLGDVGGPRTLYCSRCDSQWLYQRTGCPFCGNTDQRRLGYYPSGDESYRLYVCSECKRYVKTVDHGELGRNILLPLDRTVTFDIDRAARADGYR